jgi:hypothetical protein
VPFAVVEYLCKVAQDAAEEDQQEHEMREVFGDLVPELAFADDDR